MKKPAPTEQYIKDKLEGYKEVVQLGSVISQLYEGGVPPDVWVFMISNSYDVPTDGCNRTAYRDDADRVLVSWCFVQGYEKAILLGTSY